MEGLDEGFDYKPRLMFAVLISGIIRPQDLRLEMRTKIRS